MDEGCLVGLGWMVAMDGWMGGWMMDEVSSVDEVCSNFFFHRVGKEIVLTSNRPA